jgi:predicted MPP superfamily phosphohydrolase
MESNTSIFCISDIHISAQNHKNVLEKLSKAISMIKKFKVENKIHNCVTIFAGDIAFSGNTTEYDLISPKIEELRLISKVVFCPGNHDHNFSQYEGSIRSILLASKQYDESVIKTASEGMRE